MLHGMRITPGGRVRRLAAGALLGALLASVGVVAVTLTLSGCANGSEPADTSTVAPVSTTTTTTGTTSTSTTGTSTRTGAPSAPEFAPAPGGDLAPA